MKTIKIPTELKRELEEFGQGKSINHIMEIIFDGFDDSKEPVEDNGSININMDEIHWERLNKSKLYATETYASVIYRLLQNHQK